ncbi:guanylate kinase [Lacrimispora sp. 38-1]|uniref:guanylate kinase n=1 Tax=Lacrimispora sp. 38-1 TaxID=3125778 RepID=UPI003CE85B05
MSRIFYIMGKSASGKDTIYKKLLERIPVLKTIIPYTTRPIRDGEVNGVEYFFTNREELEQFRKEEKLIEERTYETIYGPWSYFTVDDGQFDRSGHGIYLMIGTLESYERTRDYFGKEYLYPIYVEVDDRERLLRSIERERCQEVPKYKEVCRRFLADEEDFKEENLLRCGIQVRFRNDELDGCLDKITEQIKKNI